MTTPDDAARLARAARRLQNYIDGDEGCACEYPCSCKRDAETDVQALRAIAARLEGDNRWPYSAAFTAKEAEREYADAASENPPPLHQEAVDRITRRVVDTDTEDRARQAARQIAMLKAYRPPPQEMSYRDGYLAAVEAAPAPRVPEEAREAAREHVRIHNPEGAEPCGCWACIACDFILSLETSDHRSLNATSSSRTSSSSASPPPGYDDQLHE